MNKITVEEIIKACNGKLVSGSENCWIDGVSTDSRKAKKGDVFFPIIGEIHDAHKFLPQVVENGCDTLVVSHEEDAVKYADCNVILVKDTTRALQDLASYYLDKLNLIKLAVTGSVGKTSTRDMLYYICREKYPSGKTEGNFNNNIGLPLTVFTFDDSMKACVLEMGMDHLGEIHRLVDIARPNVGVITNVGISHIEHLGSREGIRKAKMEITDFFDKNNTLVINQSNDMLNKADIKGDYKVVTVGLEPGDDYQVSEVCDYGQEGIKFNLTTDGKTYTINLGIPGAHNAINATLAIAACAQIGVTMEQAITGLGKIQLTGKRLTVKEAKGIKVFDDTYNAAPESMKSAIKTVINTKGQRKIAILGDMNELGPESAKFHYEVGQFAGEEGLDLLIAIGPKGEDIAKGARTTMREENVLFFENKEELYTVIDEILKPGDVVIVKASRSMELENVVEKIVSEQE